MKRTIKNILMILLILVLIFLTYFTLGYLTENKNFSNNIVEFKTNIILKNEENDTSTETIDENGNITTTVYEEEPGSKEVVEDPDAVVSSDDEILYSATEEEIDSNVTTTGFDDNNGAEKALDLQKTDIFKAPLVYIIAFYTECLLIAFTLAYLAFSKFNKLSLKESFYSKSRLILYILYSIVLAFSFLLGINYYLSVIN